MEFTNAHPQRYTNKGITSFFLNWSPSQTALTPMGLTQSEIRSCFFQWDTIFCRVPGFGNFFIPFYQGLRRGSRPFMAFLECGFHTMMLFALMDKKALFLSLASVSSAFTPRGVNTGMSWFRDGRSHQRSFIILLFLLFLSRFFGRPVRLVLHPELQKP